VSPARTRAELSAQTTTNVGSNSKPTVPDHSL
jgi:hypothetical protein